MPGNVAPMNLLSIADELTNDLRPLRFGFPVTHVYNPLEYARAPHAQYLRRYGRRPREIILIGMNPGPWGMVQTGVPFGEVNLVRDWLGISGPVDKPKRAHPKRPVLGFACQRSEVSGARIWGWARDRFKTPTRFFSRFFIANYCPLAFFDESGRNVTPDRLPARDREPLLVACDLALRRTVEFLRPSHVIGVGKFAENRVRAALISLEVGIGRILHPSPASPAANRDWAGQATAQLVTQGISVPGT